MAQLLYKTRAGVSPQGKPRVYFACHELDHKGYFQEITDTILKICDCAVFYYALEEVALDEDYYWNLSQMQLMVMPVTTRLLYMPSRAMDVEFTYAMEHHIPVLPLMQEQGLEKKYSEKFGDLQFLDPFIPDPTAIPYGEKLKKYLEAVLIGDEMAAKIRAAFDAYVFLSYRKKDRKYAQSLMRLLHRDPVCRDIAIWYDEFLTPGEDFNDSIREALEKSGLFVLAVTPNLVNETNYIMTTEYPMAKNAGKPILPAEMVATDAAMLQNRYPDIPPSIQPEDAQVLTAAVLSALSTLARRENKKDPAHNFFIGLAYLTGVDVEVDHKRAVELITGAAEAGLVEAMEKLVSMYEKGEGVQRDYYVAIRWQEKLTQTASQAYAKTGAQEDGETYSGHLLKLADAWKAVADLPAAQKVYETLLAHDLERWQQEPSDYNARELTLAYHRLGLLCRAEGDLTGAKAWFLKGYELRVNLAKTGTEEAQRDLLISCCLLGDVSDFEGDLKTAKVWHVKALEIAESLAKMDTAQARRDLSISYNRLGDLCKQAGDLKGAKAWHAKALEIAESLAQTDTGEAARDLALTYNRMGDICAEEGELSSAKQWQTRAVEIEETLAQSETVQARRDLSISYHKLGEIFEDEGDLDAAKAWYLRALELREALSQTGTAESWRDLSKSCNILGRVCKETGDLTGAKACYTKDLEICEIFARTGTVESWEALALARYNLAMLTSDDALLKQAVELFLAAKERRNG